LQRAGWALQHDRTSVLHRPNVVAAATLAVTQRLYYI
jgi:hypothetical protein